MSHDKQLVYLPLTRDCSILISLNLAQLMINYRAK
ncbi:hypothetical protein SPLC1_S031280 [Arthrospira platensis C1]|nr:hypothetical protein SPLC1_S031280 [Arthrospira platensis C1]